MLKKLYKYIEDVENKNIETGIEIKQAVKLFQEDLQRTDIYFNTYRAERAITFIQRLKHFEGKHAGKYFILENWQVFFIANIFGWIVKETGLRRYTDIYLEVAKKNGKTPLAAAIGLYCLIADNEPNALVILAANNTQQADTCYKFDVGFAKSIDTNEKYIKIFRSELRNNINRLKVIATKNAKIDSMSISCVILDEFHEATSTRVYSDLKSSQASREQPLNLVLTTAGYDKKSPCFSLRTTAKQKLSGLIKDDSFFVMIYSLDEGDDYRDKKNWIKSNPNLGVTVKQDFLTKAVLQAKNNISFETGIKTKNFNIWCDTLTTWIADDYILNVSKDISFDDIDEQDEIVVGVDLSSNSDITAVSYMWVKDDIFYFKNEYYLPEQSLNSAPDREYYNLQYTKGNLKLIPGNVIIYEDIVDDIMKISNNHYISAISYDPSKAQRFLIGTTNHSLKTVPYNQNLGSFNRPTSEFERLILSGKLVLDNNEITRWMLSNVFLKMDWNGNMKPDKSRNDKKIDGVIAMLQALGFWLVTPHYNGNYEVTVIKW